MLGAPLSLRVARAQKHSSLAIPSRDVMGGSPRVGAWPQAAPLVEREAMPAHHVPGVGHEEVLSDVGRQEVEEDPLVVQLHPLHVVPLLLRLQAEPPLPTRLPPLAGHPRDRLPQTRRTPTPTLEPSAAWASKSLGIAFGRTRSPGDPPPRRQMGLPSPLLPGDIRHRALSPVGSLLVQTLRPTPLTFPLGDFLSADPYPLLGNKPLLARAAPVPMALNDICPTPVMGAAFLRHLALCNHPLAHSLHRLVSTPRPRQSPCMDIPGAQRSHEFLGKSPPQSVVTFKGQWGGSPHFQGILPTAFWDPDPCST